MESGYTELQTHKMGRYLKFILPIVILGIGVLIAWQLLVHRPKAQPEAVVTLLPMVRTAQVQAQTIRIPVYSQGTVTPRTTSKLSAEVTGRIIGVAPQYANGGFFQPNEILLNINTSDYELAITKAEALVAGAKQKLAQSEAEYKQKLEEYKGVDPNSISDYALRKPQYEEAKAGLKAARADLDLAKVQLERCKIRAPFAGRIVEKLADLGQYVTPGTVLASVYAVDIAEVRLPVSPSQMEFIELPPGGRELSKPIKVMLKGLSSGTQQTWESRIVRSEAVIDERNRSQYLVAQVKDPYRMLAANRGKPPLTIGMFVEAEIEGRLLHDVYVLPRLAVHDNDKVWLLDSDMRLNIRTVGLAHRDEDKAYVNQGLNPGDTVIVSPLDAVVQGMQLRVEPVAAMTGKPSP